MFGDTIREYPKPVEIHLFDGNPPAGGPITKYVDTTIRVSSDVAPIPIRLNFTSLCDADVVLGAAWMAQHKATIDLSRGMVTMRQAPKPKINAVRRVSPKPKNPCTYPNNIPLPTRAKTNHEEGAGVSQTVDTVQAVLRGALSEMSPTIANNLPEPPT